MKTIVTWILSVLVAFAFLGASLAKFTAQPMMVREFSTFGFPIWFMYVTAVVEFIAAIALLVPRVAGFGAAALSCVMIGALFSHLTHHQVDMAIPPLALLILSLGVGWLRHWSLPSLARARSSSR